MAFEYRNVAPIKSTAHQARQGTMFPLSSFQGRIYSLLASSVRLFTVPIRTRARGPGSVALQQTALLCSLPLPDTVKWCRLSASLRAHFPVTPLRLGIDRRGLLIW